jgi:hypothetical protein
MIKKSVMFLSCLFSSVCAAEIPANYQELPTDNSSTKIFMNLQSSAIFMYTDDAASAMGESITSARILAEKVKEGANCKDATIEGNDSEAVLKGCAEGGGEHRMDLYFFKKGDNFSMIASNDKVTPEEFSMLRDHVK